VALKRRIGMGAHVKNTERRRKDLRPQASERAPIRGADRKDRIPCRRERERKRRRREREREK